MLPKQRLARAKKITEDGIMLRWITVTELPELFWDHPESWSKPSSYSLSTLSPRESNSLEDMLSRTHKMKIQLQGLQVDLLWFSQKILGKSRKKSFWNKKLIPKGFVLYLHTVPSITALTAIKRYYYYTNFSCTINIIENPMVLFI